MTAAIIIQNNKILLVENIKHNTIRMEPPGGKLELNETLEECVIREVKEELDITITPYSLFGEYETDSPEGKFKVTMYFARITEGEPRIMEPEKISKFNWYSYEEMKYIGKLLVPNLRSAMKKLEEYMN